jgi:uncharacterized protein (TIGR02453 family)
MKKSPRQPEAAAPTRFTPATLEFITRASRQKREDWLDRNRQEYEEVVLGPFRGLAEGLRRRLASSAVGYHFPTKGIARLKRSRISAAEYGTQFKDYISYNATRPSGSRFDKNPNLFFMIYPGDKDGDEVLIAGGMYLPGSRQLRAIREAIAADPTPFDRLFASKEFKARFPKGFSDERKSSRVPRGFDPAHPRLEWIKLQAFFVWRSYKKSEYTSKTFVELVANDCAQIVRMNDLLELAMKNKWNAPRTETPKEGKRPGLLNTLNDMGPLNRRKMDF